ncbi:HAMP domain-containing sensor histidine kinase [Paractinoplanes hotanensis]|uniref:histidine kinase n=1 Tax=Paractinoplanes hotanensis TaxID=2906497 RepID=A0ABT0YEB3_9ACTN|nr:HAMP domain-containing sensor histidine kinase [Actinoplanes hotanensis]MCM4083852.1 HAMP domain-containing histidine kinase [Actinoplanes hotanensis]
MALSLHDRVGATFALGALAVSAVLAVVSSALVRPVMVEQRRVSAERQAAVNAEVAGRALGEAPGSIAETLRSLDRPLTSYSLVATDGRWYASQATADAGDLPADLRAAALRSRTATANVSLPHGRSLVVVRPLAGGSGYVEVFALDDIAQTMRMLVFIMIGAGSATALAGAGLGRWAARAALRPVTALTRAAGAVAQGDLTVRMSARHDADLRPLTEAFNRTVAELHRRVQRDGRFAADVSHELRTPLTTIVNAVALLGAHRDDLKPADRELLDLLTDEVDRFRHVLTDLLEVATAAETPLATGPVPVAEIMAVADRVTGRRVSDVPLKAGAVIGDRSRLERVMTNLAVNAERHGGGLVRVAADRDAGTVRLLVEDSGPGVPPGCRREIFERFSRLHPRRTEGTGLGLALVAEEVRRHGGRVWVEDRAAGGARFVVELPAAP